MAYIVLSVAGDTLCSIARREGYSNCGTLRTTAANAGFLNGVLPPGSGVTIPQARDGWVYTKIAMGRRWTVRWKWPIAQPQPKAVRFVRTGPTPPADADAINDIGISRYITSSADGNGNDDWVDHTHRTYDAPSHTDSNAFNVEVIDPDRAGADCVVRLEALRPTYAAGVLNGHQRFPAGAERNARSLEVTLAPVAGDNTRHRSCYIRLVVDAHDKNVRPRQTLLVSDLVDGGDPEVEILDQDIRLLYEDPHCPRPAGDRCLIAQAEIPLRRGRSVRLVPRILRANRSGVVGTQANGQGDDGVITRQELIDRIQKNVRRIWAQEGITFTMAAVETVDMPSDMLVVSDPEGAASAGTNAGGVVPGVITFTLTVHDHGGAPPAVHQVGPYQVPAGQTTQQTATALQVLVNNLAVANLVVNVSPNPAIDGNAAGSTDLLFSRAGGFVTLGGLTAGVSQDQAQKAQLVAGDVGNFRMRAGTANAYAGHPMQRCLFKAFPAAPRDVRIFVVQDIVGPNHPLAHTINSQRYLPARFRPLPAVENTIVIRHEAVPPNLALKPATLAHEIGHALMDNAEHAQDNLAEGCLMNAATSQNFGTAFNGTFDTKRISDYAFNWLVPVDVNHPGGVLIPGNNAGLPVWLAQQNHSMHGLILMNNRIQFTNR